ncbi:hypothetical protein HK405_005920 [Cladochytrium tenue]|nr:hypothetical protein HK405_005920 [Cladochytrium tenue]
MNVGLALAALLPLAVQAVNADAAADAVVQAAVQTFGLTPMVATNNLPRITQICRPVADVARLDPIVAPGAVSSHAHTIVGSSGFSPDSTFDTIRADGTASSCDIIDDKSNYWYPSYFYYDSSAGTFSYRQTQVTTYYLPRGQPSNPETLYMFPSGFRMIAGNPSRRSPDLVRPMSIMWQCSDGNHDNIHYINGTEYTDGDAAPIVQDCDGIFQARVMFPSCWNGVDLYKSDQSHVSYGYESNGIASEHAPCPATHPVRFPTLMLEIGFDSNYRDNPANADGSPRFCLSTGDCTGHGMHADFMNGWRPGLFETLYTDCGQVQDGGGGLVNSKSSCPAHADEFHPDGSDLSGVHVAPAVAAFEEAHKTFDVLDSLPGCQVLTFVEGPDVSPIKPCDVPAATLPPPSSSQDTGSGGTGAAISSSSATAPAGSSTADYGSGGDTSGAATYGGSTTASDTATATPSVSASANLAASLPASQASSSSSAAASAVYQSAASSASPSSSYLPSPPARLCY